jgi:glucokinase
VVGVDLGGSHVYAAVIDAKGVILAQADADIDRARPPEQILRGDVAVTVRAAIVAAESRSGASPGSIAVKGVGMGLPGNIDRVRGICRFSPNFHWRDVAVAAPLQEELGQPVFLLNDVRSHTLGERHFGAGRGHQSFAMLAIGTGIGGGLVIGGRLIEGAHSAGGELGHITVDPLGPRCGCGNDGCVEAVASGPAIVRAAQASIAAGRGGALLAQAGGDPGAITPAQVASAAEAGDAEALAIFTRAGEAIGIAVAAVMTTVDPEVVLIGGGVGQAGELLLRPIREEAARRCRMVPAGATPVIPAALGEKAGLVGAAALALESLGLLDPVLV